MIQLDEMIEETRVAKRIAAEATIHLKDLKEDLRTFMLAEDILEYKGVQIRRTFSFDIPMLKYEKPEIAEIFITRETRTVIKEFISKKNQTLLKAKHPEIYKEIRLENTPQLRGL